MALLEMQGGSHGYFYSLERDNEFHEQLEDYFNALFGYGVVAGGTVEDNGGISVLVPEGFQLAYGGLLFVLDDDQVYNGLANNALNTLWGRAKKTQASQSDQTELSTYVLELTSNTSDAEPAVAAGTAHWSRLAKVLTASGDIVTMMQGPPGKNLRLTDPLRAGRNTIGAGEVSIVEANESLLVAGPLTVSGVLWVHGKVTVI